MIVVTGAAGFIGSVVVEKLNAEGFINIVLVDDFSKSDKKSNYISKKYTCIVERNDFAPWLRTNQLLVDFVIHLGARTDTTEFDTTIFDALNLNYSKSIWTICTEFGIPFIYASSAATYGLGEFGYEDDHALIPQLKPLNPYGDSKNDFDTWVLQQEDTPSFWAGLKFFNVYGPNEYHKGRMASVIFHAYHQILKTGKMKLFRSHKDGIGDGEQSRDFVYVLDVASIIYWLMHHRKDSGIYNLGSGKARSFNDLVKATFKAMVVEENIEYIDTPLDIRDTYQYFTEANMNKLKSIGYPHAMHSLEEGVEDYVKGYLGKELYY